MKLKKAFIIASAIISSCMVSPIVAFEWPQELLGNDFALYFGQLRGQRINPSLLFKEKLTVKSADEGQTSIVLGNHSQELGWFPSTLGDAVLISHKNNLITIYANLDKDTITPKVYTSEVIPKETELGRAGNSAWQSKSNGLEFQVIDTKNKAMINPRLLMPHLQSEPQYYIGNVTIDDKKGNSYNLNTVKALYSGTYSFYRDKDELNIPFKVNITINGETVHSYQFDSLSTTKNKVCLGGSPYLTVDYLYPDNKRQLLGTVNLSRGRNLVVITLTNFLGETRTASYAFDVN